MAANVQSPPAIVSPTLPPPATTTVTVQPNASVKKPKKSPRGPSIQSAIAAISKSTSALNTSVLAFTNSTSPILPIGVLGILECQRNLAAAMQTAVTIAQSAPKLDVFQAIGVYKAAQELVKMINETLNNIRLAKKKFDNLYVAAPVLVKSLKENRAAAKVFNDVLVEKLPRPTKGFARPMAKQIDEQFVKTIDVYDSSFFGWNITL